MASPVASWRSLTSGLVWSLVATVVVAGSVAAVGCSAGGGGAIPDAGLIDAVFEVSLDLPVGCPPAVGNDKGVGKPCTRGGGECKSSNSTFVCTCDNFLGIRLDGVPCICTVVTLSQNPDAGDLCAAQSASVCGTGATCCAYMSIGTYCAPDICLPDGLCPDVSGP
jgi:hypothetical protein